MDLPFSAAALRPIELLINRGIGLSSTAQAMAAAIDPTQLLAQLTEHSMHLPLSQRFTPVTKFGKFRMVPLHPSVIGPLAAYRALRRQYVPPKPQMTFFVGSRGVHRYGQDAAVQICVRVG